MSNESVLLEIDATSGIATITLNRPQALNALDVSMAAGLRDATFQVAHDAAIRAVIIQGAGDHFMAGGDIKTFHAALDEPSDQRRKLFEQLIGEVHESVIRVRTMEKPVIASVRGAVAGFGLSLMNACDLALAAENSYFTLAYCHIGTSPDGGGTFGLPRLVGLKQAMEIALLGDRFNAQRALELGLVNRVVPLSDLTTASQAMATRLANGPTLALGRTKRLINESLDRTLPEQLLAEQNSFAACAMTQDFARGVRAFVEKRKPGFQGN
jgi:2-(1,2-epoxy-1,2-dihydrophenyl)acetyl-CoA isomerase